MNTPTPTDQRTIVAPSRSHDQRLESLALANRIRSSRARTKMDMKAGLVTASELLRDPPEHIASMKLFSLLTATPKVGVVKANAFLRRAGVSPSKTVGGITDRQREALMLELTGR